MPTYEYVCDQCEHEFELFQQMSDSVKRKCPECGKLKLRRLIGTGAGVIFKGSGFYQTDYRSDSYKKGAEAEKKAKDSKSKDSKDSDGKSDKKKSADSSTSGSSTSDSKPSTSKPSSKNKSGD